MTYRVFIDTLAQREIDEFARYARSFSEQYAVEQFARLDRIIDVYIAGAPLRWGYSPLTRAPYRGSLYYSGPVDAARIGSPTRGACAAVLELDTKLGRTASIIAGDRGAPSRELERIKDETRSRAIKKARPKKS